MVLKYGRYDLDLVSLFLPRCYQQLLIVNYEGFQILLPRLARHFSRSTLFRNLPWGFRGNSSGKSIDRFNVGQSDGIILALGYQNSRARRATLYRCLRFVLSTPIRKASRVGLGNQEKRLLLSY
jgi:hypothetical protein